MRRPARGSSWRSHAIRMLLLGYQLRSIKAGTFSTVMLASPGGMHQVTRGGAVLVNELNAVWAGATARRPAEATTPAQSGGGPQP